MGEAALCAAYAIAAVPTFSLVVLLEIPTLDSRGRHVDACAVKGNLSRHRSENIRQGGAGSRHRTGGAWQSCLAAYETGGRQTEQQG